MIFVEYDASGKIENMFHVFSFFLHGVKLVFELNLGKRSKFVNVHIGFLIGIDVKKKKEKFR